MRLALRERSGDLGLKGLLLFCPRVGFENLDAIVKSSLLHVRLIEVTEPASTVCARNAGTLTEGLRMDALLENVPHMVPAKIDPLAALDDCNPADVFMAILRTGMRHDALESIGHNVNRFSFQFSRLITAVSSRPALSKNACSAHEKASDYYHFSRDLCCAVL